MQKYNTIDSYQSSYPKRGAERQTEGPLFALSLWACPRCLREREAAAEMPKKQVKLNSQDPPIPHALRDLEDQFHSVKFIGDFASYGKMWQGSFFFFFLTPPKVNKKPIQESYAHLTSPFHQQWAAETGKEKFASETPGGSRVTLAPPSSAACPPEGKQREPEIASLPAVRQEATSPTTESAHAIDSESCPVIHLQRLAASHPAGEGRLAGGLPGYAPPGALPRKAG